MSYRYDKTYGTLQVPYVADPNYLNSPAGLFIEASDNLYVTEESGFRVLEYDPTPTISLTLGIAGHPAWMFGGDKNLFDSPHDVALDNSGNTWVTDGNRVAQFDPSGVYLRQLVDSGDPINPFIDLWGIAFDSQGRMFVSDIYNQRVQVYDISPITPTLVDTIGEVYDPSVGGCLSDNNHFCYPWRIAIDSLDQLYVADKDNDRVQKCTYSSGWSCASFDSGLNQPRGLTVDGNDNVYIADNGRIRKCISGNCNDLVTDTLHFMDLAVDSAGNVYAAASWDIYTVYQYASTGQLLDAEYIGHVGVPYPADLDHYYFPLVNTDAEDNILITEEWGHQLIKLYHDGTPPWSFGEAGVAGWDDEHLNSPMRVATDSSGNIYVPNAWACGVQVISPDGDYIKSIGGPDSCGSGDVQFNATLGVAIDNNGYLYVADSGNQRVQILDISLITPTLVATIGVTGDCHTDNDHLCAPSSVALDTAGNIYIADTGNHRV